MKYKVLTMCAGGCVRSVALKYLLKYKYGHESLACGQDANSAETIELLCKWADYIVVMTEDYKKFVPDAYKSKLLCYDVGVDRFGYAFHPELMGLCDKMIIEHGLFNL
jgi:predicted protein tyrosine phosphatase